MNNHQSITKTSLRGMAVLENPKLNKGTAFTREERENLGLLGLLPDSVEDIDRQVERVLHHLEQKPSDLERYIYLNGLSDRNETLFFKVVMSDSHAVRAYPIRPDRCGSMPEVRPYISARPRHVRLDSQ